MADTVHRGASSALRLSKAIYSGTAVSAASHRLTGLAHVVINESDDGTAWQIELRSIDNLQRAEALAGQLANDALDQTLRETLASQTQSIRAVIIAQAFSRASLLHPELDQAEPFDDALRIGQPDAVTGRDHQ